MAKGKRDSLLRLLADSLLQLQRDVQQTPATAERLAQLVTSGDRERLVQELLAELVPAHVDHAQWQEWFEGGAPPVRGLDAGRPTMELQDDTGRVRSARGAYLAAESERDQLRQRVENARAKLANLEAEFSAAEAKVQEAEGWLRTGVVWLLMREISRQTAGVFAMGPAWSLMRIVSGYIQSDPSFENDPGLDPDQLARRKERRPRETLEILRALDEFSGDERFELNVHNAIYSAAIKHRKLMDEQRAEAVAQGRPVPSAKRFHRRTSEEQKRSVHPASKIDDAARVSDGFVNPKQPKGS